MNFQEFKQLTAARSNDFASMWTFTTTGYRVLSSFKITTSSGNVKISWSDGSPDDVVSSDQIISHTYTV